MADLEASPFLCSKFMWVYLFPNEHWPLAHVWFVYKFTESFEGLSNWQDLFFYDPFKYVIAFA